MPETAIRVLTWNLFHGRDGLPGLGATLASTLLGRAVDDGVHVHLNRRLTDRMAELIAAWDHDLVALQEVPTAAVPGIVRATGMRALGTLTGPAIGPRRVRDALATRNPDLWRTHEGNANLILAGPGWTTVPGSARGLNLSPLGAILRDARRPRGLRALPGRLAEPRRMVWARLRGPGGAEVTMGCLHCHGSRDPEIVGSEIARAAAALRGAAREGPAILAGDLNADGRHPALAALAREGWGGAGAGSELGIDRILHLGLEAGRPPLRLPPERRELRIDLGAGPRRVRLSDHDPVEATLLLTGSGSTAGPPGAR